MIKLLSRFKCLIRGDQDLEKLIRRGLKVGKNFKRMKDVLIDPSHCWHISIGDNVTLAPRVHILAHDASMKTFLGFTRVANIKIGDNVFVGAGAIILPGVTVGDNVIIGAGSIVTKDIPNDSIALGNPAHVVKSLDEFLSRHKSKMLPDNLFGEEFTLRNKAFGEKERMSLLKACKEYGDIYVN